MTGGDHLNNSGDHYPVFIGDSALKDGNDFLASMYTASKLFILTDENVYHHCLPRLMDQCPFLKTAEILAIRPGERSKDISMVVDLWKWLTGHNAARGDLMINLGGGVISDLGGFVAGTYKRGIAFVNIPTTLIGQADASLGGKTGINVASVKNLAGSFNNPSAVCIHPPFLETLPGRELKAGYAEIIKSALISGGEFWALCTKGNGLNEAGLLELIRHSVKVKMAFAEKDPYDLNVRRALNFGHTVGHAMESLSFEDGHELLLHGEAIAAGMICEGYLSVAYCGLDPKVLESLSGILKGIFKRIEFDQQDTIKMLQFMIKDKKNREGKVNVTLLSAPGKVLLDQGVRNRQITEALRFYRENFGI